MLTAEQVMAAQKANVETLFGLTSKAFEGVEKLVELNVTASKAALVEAAGTAQSILSVKDAQELLALQASLFQPLAEKTAAYSRHLYDISASTGAEFGKTFESQVADAQKTRQIGMREAQREQAVRIAQLDKEQQVGEQTALFEKEMQVAEADRAKRISIADANAKAFSGEARSQAEVAGAQAELQVRKAEAYQLAETKKREAEAAVLEAQNRAMARKT